MSTLDPFHLSTDMPVDITGPDGHHTWGLMSSQSWDGDFALPCQALDEGRNLVLVFPLVGEGSAGANLGMWPLPLLWDSELILPLHSSDVILQL